MKIRTNIDLYVGRYHFEVIDGRHYSHFNAIIPYGMTEPFKIPKFTEVVKCSGEEFDSYREFLETLEEGMFTFKFNDEAQETLFEMLIECANMVNYDENSFDAVLTMVESFS